MKIYISHSSQFDYRKELYEPLLKKAHLDEEHTLILPHKNGTAPQNSKARIKTSDIIIAEVSYPSTGQGIELGWANIFDVPIYCFYRKEGRPSSSLKFVCKTLTEYKDADDLVKKVQKLL